MLRFRLFLLGLLVCFFIATASAGDRFITVASTTSTLNSGLLDFLLPQFEAKTAIEVRVVAVGTGKAIRMAQSGDADVLLVHHKSSEEKFVAEGYGVRRFDLMYNDFIIVGPDSNPAGIVGKSVPLALEKIAASKSIFVSRGDDSGTHKKEISLWTGANLQPAGGWYRETGSGMGTTLNVASGSNGYALTDRATWLKFGNKQGMKVVLEGDPNLFNQYGVVLVSPERHQHIKAEDGQTFIDWLLSAEGQQAINSYRLEGQQAFFGNAAAQ